MIASRESTAETMMRALSYSLGALDTAAELDVDRGAEDRAFFTAERATLQASFNEVSTLVASSQHRLRGSRHSASTCCYLMK